MFAEDQACQEIARYIWLNELRINQLVDFLELHEQQPPETFINALTSKLNIPEEQAKALTEWDAVFPDKLLHLKALTSKLTLHYATRIRRGK